MAAALSHQRVAELHKRAQESVDQYARGAQKGKTALDGLHDGYVARPSPGVLQQGRQQEMNGRNEPTQTLPGGTG